MLKTGEITIKEERRPSFRIHDNSESILKQSKNNKRPSIMITVIPDNNLSSSLVPPRRMSMRVGTGKTPGIIGFNNQLMFEISPSTTSKRPSFRLVNDGVKNDLQSNESPLPHQRNKGGFVEKVLEEEEGDDEEIKSPSINKESNNNVSLERSAVSQSQPDERSSQQIES